MQLKQRFLVKKKILPKEINMCRICTSNVGCGSGDMVSGTTGGQFGLNIFQHVNIYICYMKH